VDISPYLYERGAFYTWTKIPNVQFTPDYVSVGTTDYDGGEERYASRRLAGQDALSSPYSVSIVQPKKMEDGSDGLDYVPSGMAHFVRVTLSNGSHVFYTQKAFEIHRRRGFDNLTNDVTPVKAHRLAYPMFGSGGGNRYKNVYDPKARKWLCDYCVSGCSFGDGSPTLNHADNYRTQTPDEDGYGDKPEHLCNQCRQYYKKEGFDNTATHYADPSYDTLRDGTPLGATNPFGGLPMLE
jgi:hypothetical protein